MTYTALTALGLSGALLLDLVILGTKLLGRKAFWVSYAIMLAFQLVVNGVLAGARVVMYNSRDILGPRLGSAPVEDIGFGFTLILITLSSWVALNRRRSLTDGPATS